MGRRWVHLVLGGALLMPFFLLASVVLPLVADGADPLRQVGWQLAAFGCALPPAALAALLFPLLRPLEVAAVRSLCGVPAEQLAEGPAVSWAARRRTALWFVAHLLAGGIVSGMTLSAPPAAVLLLLLPFSAPLRHIAPGWPDVFHGALGPLAGLALLALVAGTSWGAGALLGRVAPVLLGPTPADRLAAAERRAADLASRNRLARELHDAVGHALSAVTLQAGAARRVLDTDPEFARRALAAIEETTRDAVAELDTVLGLLREEDGSDPAAPAPTLDGLEALLGRTRAAGVPVEATVEGPCAGLAPVVSREAYRIVQEGLSNALRHAGPVPVRLHLGVREGELRIRVENPVAGPAAGSAGPAARPGGGRGLRGIAERARLLGGAAVAEERDGVWQLTARLPLTGAGTGTGSEER
ncbi:histidine kinase [Streptomyces sp. Je 1-4]|uniref:sensor histidine kinase n=1 Tax=Streptomyces TaxID=1883 RepID=UPI00140F03AC|nr:MULTISPECIES: histidine kinase [unclassified Streptomyces]QIK09392.1 histidine kinase [Streptomyces sp. ID38640]UYB43093.1 histidine kinase [Streptomyces sp. Je 1-4]UZQ39446.1 histidine kinase [Streptomyces sp. Je 1-4] [Streptomyces sp. Je 1-4 4N24]UZQ46863.1 histidine kinase [Streptomyces sp. Je 1-4] [Streptomyces sp. Je 1-4 4N24_ara]